MQVAKLSLIALISLYAHSAGDYASFLNDVETCFKSLNVSHYGPEDYSYDKAQVRGILNGRIKRINGCANQKTMKVVASMIDRPKDCVRTAMDMRNQYLKFKGEKPVLPNLSPISTLVMSQKVSAKKYRNKFTYRPVDLNNPNDENILNLKSGSMLYFNNVNCPQWKSRFSGHAMTVIRVERDSAGRPFAVDVLDGHAGNKAPTYRKIFVEDLYRNGKGEDIDDDGVPVPPIPGITCCAFEGVTNWVAEEGSPSSSSSSAYKPSSAREIQGQKVVNSISTEEKFVAKENIFECENKRKQKFQVFEFSHRKVKPLGLHLEFNDPPRDLVLFSHQSALEKVTSKVYSLEGHTYITYKSQPLDTSAKSRSPEDLQISLVPLDEGNAVTRYSAELKAVTKDKILKESFLCRRILRTGR